MDDGIHGVEATIIDLGLSRLDSGAGDGIHWTPIDDEVFEGQGDLQYDVYRMMRDVNKDWKAYNPLTNVMVCEFTFFSIWWFELCLLYALVVALLGNEAPDRQETRTARCLT